MKRLLALSVLFALLAACTSHRSISTPAVVPVKVSDVIPGSTGNLDRMQRGIDQCAALWRAEDGTQADFEAFVKQWLATTPQDREALLEKLARALEIFRTQQNQLTIELGRPTVLAEGEPGEIDYLLTSYDAYAHFSDDL